MKSWQTHVIGATVFCLLSGGPPLIAALLAPQDWQFLGALASPDDVSVYLAAIYQGFRGQWLYRAPFDPTPTSPLLMYSLYLSLGHMARLLGANLVLIYHLGRLVCGLFVLYVADRWAAVLFPGRQGRITAWILVAFSSGLGWLLALIPSADWQASLLDLRSPEASTFLAAFTAPHFALGVALEALAFLFFWRAIASKRWLLWAISCGIVLQGLGLVYPFTMPVVYVTLLAYVLWTLGREGWRSGHRLVRAAAIATGIPLPFVAYYVSTFFMDPFWRETHVAQNVISSPAPWWLLAGYGLLLILAAWGGVNAVRDRSGPWSLVSLWVLCNALMLYLPVTFQWRLANGWHLGLALLAARGLQNGVVPWLANRRLGRTIARWSPDLRASLRRVGLILTMPSTLMVSLVGVRIAAAEQGFPHYLPARELEAMDWMSQQTNYDDVVLGAYPTGNVLPTRGLCRVVVGQQFSTLDPQQKLVDVERFFHLETPDAEREAILDRYGVAFVYHGTWERNLGAFDPAMLTTLSRIYHNDQVSIYRVLGD